MSMVSRRYSQRMRAVRAYEKSGHVAEVDRRARGDVVFADVAFGRSQAVRGLRAAEVTMSLAAARELRRVTTVRVRARFARFVTLAAGILTRAREPRLAVGRAI